MIESIEGKRGMPRLRPPYVAQVGLFGRPTLEHNFETLYWVRELLREGRARGLPPQGRNGRKGLRSFSVSGARQESRREARAGRHHHPGADRGVLRRHARRPRFLRLPAGRRLGRHPARLDGRHPARFRHLQPHGCFIGSAAVIVLSNQDTAKAAARNMMRFFEHESCGQCTPCRVGTAKTNLLIDARPVGPRDARGSLAGDARRIDLRPGSGGAESGGLRDQILSERSDLKGQP